MAVPEIRGNLLRAPSDQNYSTIERQRSRYRPLQTFALDKEKQYQQQYGDMYFLRLTKIKPAVELHALEAWDGVTIGGETVRKVERVLDVRQGDLCWVTGTIYMEMPLKPNILEDISMDHWTSAPPPRQKYLSASGEDLTMLEDESGRLRLVGAPLAREMLVTGCIVSVMGTENVNGDFEVVDIKFPELPPQPERWQTSRSDPAASRSTKVDELDADDDDEDDDNDNADTDVHGDKDNDGDENMDKREIHQKRKKNKTKIAIVSGLGFSGASADHSLEIQLLTEYLLGEALDPTAQAGVAHISRLIIAGNSIRTDNDAVAHDTIGNTRKTHKKYGYDSSAYNPLPTAHLDTFLAALLPSMPITLIPGTTDPANVALPQQPLHPALFPAARVYGPDPVPGVASADAGVGWFDPVTNPWEGEIEGWRVLGSGGQNLDDVFKYIEGDDRIGMLEAMCRWRCCAPTAPDTLWSYPFQTHDPFVLSSCPHIFFAGSQARFDTAIIDGPDGQTVRLIAVPSFDTTGELVLVDVETRAVEVVRFSVG